MRRSTLFALALALAACGGSGGGSDAGFDAGGTSIQPTLSSIQAGIFRTGCAVSGCHDATSHQANLVLSDAQQSYAHLVNQPAYEIAPAMLPDGGLEMADGGLYVENICNGLTDGGVVLRVAPGDSAHSYLIWKLSGSDADGHPIEHSALCTGMPRVSGAQLPDSEIQVIRQWIDQGALQN